MKEKIRIKVGGNNTEEGGTNYQHGIWRRGSSCKNSCPSIVQFSFLAIKLTECMYGIEFYKELIYNTAQLHQRTCIIDKEFGST